MTPIVALDSVGKSYDGPHGERTVALLAVGFTVAQQEFISLIGPSGCGKSTLLNIIAGLLQPSSGGVSIAGNSPQTALDQRKIGIVFQDAVLLPWKTVVENARFLLMIAGRLDGAAQARVDELLRIVGLAEFRNHYPHQLSGGMRQRLSIARALALDPLLLLMDEPFGALDEFTRHRMNVELLDIWSATRKTVVFVTHNIAEAVFMSDRVIAMSPRPGRVVDDFRVELPRPRTKEVRYTREFNDCVVHLQRLLERDEDTTL
ncbi:MAG: ABC transporter ATP-binding protein [Burkholderiales bacterium]|nr:ABC transporter ATP-binding protein [Burkholderiales bacterium]